MHSVDYIIIGQGLAGSAVAVQLLRRNKKILVLDQPENNSSSRIAAGLFNPVTGRKMTRTWQADTLFPYLHEFYRDTEALTGTNFFHPMSLYRPFVTIEEQNEWMGKSAEAAYAPYIEKVFTQSAFATVKDTFGGLLLKQCGYLDTTAYTKAVGQWIRKDNLLLHEAFEPDKLQVSSDSIQYKDFTAGHIIFCYGVHANPWFGWLPIKALKGETIRIKSTFKDTVILNRGVYVVPAGESGEWRVGATYDFHSTLPGTTAEAKAELEQKLDDLVDFPYQCTGQEWGLRPTTPDRRPILGSHPEASRVIVFNGLGTKGVSLSPYFSDVLIRWIENKIPLVKEVDIERYKSVYWSSPK